jgi:hypothetical protein
MGVRASLDGKSNVVSIFGTEDIFSLVTIVENCTWTVVAAIANGDKTWIAIVARIVAKAIEKARFRSGFFGSSNRLFIQNWG